MTSPGKSAFSVVRKVSNLLRKGLGEVSKGTAFIFQAIEKREYLVNGEKQKLCPNRPYLVTVSVLSVEGTPCHVVP